MINFIWQVFYTICHALNIHLQIPNFDLHQPSSLRCYFREIYSFFESKTDPNPTHTSESDEYQENNKIRIGLNWVIISPLLYVRPHDSLFD